MMTCVVLFLGILHVLSVCGVYGSCDFNLVTGSYGVDDDAITASSSHPDCPIIKVRFSSAGGWCPEILGNGHYVQVHFKALSAVKAIQTRGRGDYSQWMTSYKVNISMDGITWNSILDSTTGQVKGNRVVNKIGCFGTCLQWERKLGSSGDIFTVLMDMDAPNQTECGLKCYRHGESDSFLFDASSTRCRLLNATTEYSNTTVDLHGVWYFRKNH